jgi:hypothetical protein
VDWRDRYLYCKTAVGVESLGISDCRGGICTKIAIFLDIINEQLELLMEDHALLEDAQEVFRQGRRTKRQQSNVSYGLHRCSAAISSMQDILSPVGDYLGWMGQDVISLSCNQISDFRQQFRFGANVKKVSGTASLASDGSLDSELGTAFTIAPAFASIAATCLQV